MKRFFVTGGAGFIGSNIVRRLLADNAAKVTIFDNFCTGKRWHIEALTQDKRFKIIEGNIRDLPSLRHAMADHDIVIHLASNADIAKAAQEPLIDFEEGTILTQYVLEAMRTNTARRIVFTSGAGVYGDLPPQKIPENYPGMHPISTYGASKLASEALISAYGHMFGFMGTVVRFANVVGPMMTHGVTHDFIDRLKKEPQQLTVLGDGNQTKPYVYVDDIIEAIMLLLKQQTTSYECYNVASEDQLTVRQIADLVVQEMKLKDVAYNFTGGERGWRADVPIYHLDTNRLRSLGWSNKLNSQNAVLAAIRARLKEVA